MEQKKIQTAPFEGGKKPKQSAVPGKHGIGYSTARHLARLGMKKAMEKQPVKEETELKHRVSVTVSDPQHSMVSKRGEKTEKKIRLYAKDEKHAQELAKHHLKKQGYKVHDSNYIGVVEETENVNEVSANTAMSYLHKTYDTKGYKDHTPQTKKGIERATRKVSQDAMRKDYEKSSKLGLSTEEVEKVDEISNELLQRYKQKAGAQVDNPATPSSMKYKRGKGHLMATLKQMKSGKPMPPIQKEDQEMFETKSAPKGFHFTKDGKLKRGDADRDGSGGPMLRSDPLDKQRSKVPPVSEEDQKVLKNKAHQHNMDAAQREIDRRDAEGEDMTGAKIHPTTYEIIKPKRVKEEISRTSFKQFRASLQEKTLTPSEIKKREEVAKAIERENPNMPMGMKMAIATKTAKRVAEEVDQAQEDTHLCAKHVRSALLGDGVVLEAQHAEPDAEGNIEWYLVEFKDGIHKVFTEDLEIMIAEYHGNHKKKKMTNG